MKMIDTIRLAYDTKTIPEEFKISKSKKGVFSGIINPTKEMKASGKYYPRVTFVKRPVGYGRICQQILIEFSIPKLLKSNNFSEVCDADFDDVVQALKSALFDMGIKWQFTACIENYKVVKVDYSKNIIFDDGTTVSQIIRLFNAANISKRMDVSAGEYRNGGQIFRIHTNYRDIVFYDKIADLKRSRVSEKRCIEKDNFVQTSLFDFFEKKRRIAVLRFEVRLNGVKEIKSNLEKVGQNTDDLTFKKMFSSEISKAVLLNWWEEIFNKIPKTPLDDKTTANVLIGLLKNKEAKPQKVLASIGLLHLQNDKNLDSRFIKEIFDKRFTDGSWNRVVKAQLKPEESKNIRYLLYIKTIIQEMKPVNIDDYRDDF